jgi:hypothetical protein
VISTGRSTALTIFLIGDTTTEHRQQSRQAARRRLHRYLRSTTLRGASVVYMVASVSAVMVAVLHIWRCMSTDECSFPLCPRHISRLTGRTETAAWRAFCNLPQSTQLHTSHTRPLPTLRCKSMSHRQKHCRYRLGCPHCCRHTVRCTKVRRNLVCTANNRAHASLDCRHGSAHFHRPFRAGR